MSKSRNKAASVLKEVREVKYRQRVVPDKKKQEKKNPPPEKI